MNLSQLRAHWKEPDAAPPPEVDISKSPTAAGILGLGRSRRRVANLSLEREVESYLDDMESGSSALAYWQVSYVIIHILIGLNYEILQENHLRYPTIFTLAMDILPIQGSSVPCERVFSSAKETLTDRRSHILPELMEGLQLLKYSVKHGRSLNFTAGNSWDDERAAMEKLMEIDGDAPEDLKAFQEFLVRSKAKATDDI